MADNNRVFTDEELAQLSRYKPELIAEQISEGLYDDARETIASLASSIGFLHNAAAAWIGGLVSYLYEEYGEECLISAEMHSLRQERMDALPKNPLPDFDGICRYTLREIKGLCGCGLAVEEDDEKLTIKLAPCGTGGMLLNAEKEEAASGIVAEGFARIKGPSPLTFGEDELPAYCVHCALSEIRDYDETGHLCAIHAKDSLCSPKSCDCKLYIYKDPDLIPEEYYTRLGLKKPARESVAPYTTKRMFTDAELYDMQTPTETLVEEALSKDDKDAALVAFARYYEEKTHMHDAVGCRVGALLTWVYERDGLEGVDKAERYAHGIEGRLLMKPSEAENLKDIVIDNLHGLSGHVHQVNTLTEDDEKISVQVNRCGSGGRMIARGAYREGGGFAVLKGPSPLIWGLKELPIYCFHCPLFERLAIERSGSLASVKTDFYLSGESKSPACDFVFYKNTEDIPERYYTRSGKKKP